MSRPTPLAEIKSSQKYGGPATPIKAVAIAGFSNCGKTELICRLISLAGERGFRVAAVKHSHKILEVDLPGKDTWRFRQAGARTVALTGPGLLQVTHFPTGDLPAEAVLTALPHGADFVLVEGYKHGSWPKMIFVPAGNSGAALPSFPNIIAYISEHPLTADLPVFSRDQVPEILDFILRWLNI